MAKEMLANHQRAHNRYADPFNNGLYHSGPSLSQEIDTRQLENAELDAGLAADIAAIEEDLDEMLYGELGQSQPGSRMGKGMSSTRPFSDMALEDGDNLVGKAEFEDWFTHVLASTS